MFGIVKTEPIAPYFPSKTYDSNIIPYPYEKIWIALWCFQSRKIHFVSYFNYCYSYSQRLNLTITSFPRIILSYLLSSRNERTIPLSFYPRVFSSKWCIISKNTDTLLQFYLYVTNLLSFLRKGNQDRELKFLYIINELSQFLTNLIS